MPPGSPPGEVGSSRLLQPDGVEIVNIDGGAITIGTSWRYGDVRVGDLIDTAEDIEGFPCVHLEHIVAYKRIADRPKDRAHLAIIAATFYGESSEWEPVVPHDRLIFRTIR